MKCISFALVSIFFLVSFLGVCLAMVMNHDMLVMGDCLHIMNRSIVCPMGLGKLLDTGKSMLIFQPVKFFAAYLFVGFSAVAFFIFHTFDAARTSPKRLWREWLLLTFFLPLRHMFSRGILHSRRYA